MNWLRKKIETYRSAYQSKRYYKKNLSNLHHQLIDFYNSLFGTNLEISIGFGSPFGSIPSVDFIKKKVFIPKINKHLADKLGVSLDELYFSSLAHEEGERYYSHVNPFIQEFLKNYEREVLRHIILEATKSVESHKPSDAEIATLFVEGIGTASMNRALDKFGFEETKLLENRLIGKIEDKKYSLEDVIKIGIPLIYIGFSYRKYKKVIEYFSGLNEKDFQKEVRKDPRQVYEIILGK